MQQRGANSVNMDNEIDEDLSLPQASRGRNNSKLANKLVRSHAMREEASPPRDVLMAAAAAAAANTTSNQTESKSPSPCATSSPNTLSPPIQHRVRSPDLATAQAQCATSGNPLLVLSPSTSPSENQTNTRIDTEISSSHSIQCYYHHHHQCQQQVHPTTCTAQHPRSSPTNNGAGAVMASPLASRRCCSPPPPPQQQQQQQMLVTVDYVGSGESSGDDRLTGGATSHKVNKLNRQNVDLCTNNSNKQRHTSNIILEESSQQTKAPKCDCNESVNNNFHQQQHQPISDRQHQVVHSSGVGGGGGQQLNHCNSANSVSSNQTSNNNNQLMVVNRANNRGKLRQQSSSQSYGSFDGSHSSMSLNASPCLSRDNSSEQYTDTTGVDLDTFIPETLNRNAKDRALMLRIEEELVGLAKDQNRTHYKFPPMSSYQRMLVHRCAAYFGMDHNIESSGKCVVVNRTKATRIPSVPFKEHLRTDTYLPPSNYSNAGSATGSTTSLVNNNGNDGGAGDRDQSSIVRRSILKRGDNSGGSMDEITGSGRRDMMMLLSAAGGSGDKRSKSFEEREEEYVKARRRIFNPMIDHDHRGGSNDEFRWSDVRWPSTDSDMSIKNKLHPVEHYHPHRCRPGGRLQKVQSEEKGEDTLRPCVAKSYSFGGYGGCFTRGDSILSTHSASPRLLTKQDSTTSSSYQRLSPSSSGYKTQSSQRSTESVTPSPTSTPYLSNSNTHRQDSSVSTVSGSTGTSCGGGDSVLSSLGADVGGCGGGQMVFWAVTDVDSVPRGSVIINPQTGMAVRNDDGSVYRYDPGNPPVGMTGGRSGAKSGGETAVEKHTNYTETKVLLPEPLMEEPPVCSNEIVLAQSSKRQQHCDGGKPPVSPNHHYRHNQLNPEHMELDDTVAYHHQHHHQQQQQDVQHCQAQSGPDSSLILGHSPSHGSPQRRRKNSPFRKQENFVQASVDKPIMVSTYTSTTNSPSPPLYSPPPAPSHPSPILPPTPISNHQQPPTPLPSRPSSVLSQHTQHSQPQIPTITNNTQQQAIHHHNHLQQQRYGTTAYHMMPVEQQPYLGPPLYPGIVGAEGAVLYGPGIQPPQQPCFVYGYGVPVGAPTAAYNPPMENGMAEVGVNMGVGGYYIADGAGAGAITYQTLSPATWAGPNQISYYAAPAPAAGSVGPAPPGPRFSMPMHAQPAPYMYNSHHASSNYMTCPAAAAPAHQPTELIPLYSPVPGGQPAVVFSQHPAPVTAPAQGTTVAGPAQLYPAAIYGAGNIPAYTPPPQQAPMPATPLLQQYYSASSATSTPTGHGVGFSYPISAPTPPMALAATSCAAGGGTTPIPMMGNSHPFGQIVHGMNQLAVGSKGRNVHHLDRRNSMQRLNKMAAGSSSGRNVPFGQGGSSQSSTEPSSPATTVVPPPVYGGGYRLPGGADTPPLGAHMMGGPQQFLPPHCNNMLIRPMNAVHSSPPVATMSRSSRSPTPAGCDFSLIGDRPKFPTLPATVTGVYHPGATMPLMIPTDARLGMRGPSGPFRQLSPHQVRPQQQQIPGMDRAVRNRKPR